MKITILSTAVSTSNAELLDPLDPKVAEALVVKLDPKVLKEPTVAGGLPARTVPLEKSDLLVQLVPKV